MKFKEQIQQDAGVFLNQDEFAELHNIDGLDIPAVIDSDIVKIRGNNKAERFDGVFSSQLAVYIRPSDLPDRPVYGQHIRLDDKLYIVQECVDNDGMLEITLGANDS